MPNPTSHQHLPNTPTNALMHRPALTFGIEIECSVATLSPWQKHPDPTETRTAHFPKAPLAVDIPGTFHEDVSHHIRETLIAAGLRVKPTPSYSLLDAYQHPPGKPDFTIWDVTDDVSIHGPVVRNSYKAVGVEIRSPAYFFNADALKEVGFALGVLTKTYLLAVNKSTGLHVHVGNGLESFSFDTVRRLIAFLYAFEPQLNSLHPQYRFNTGWACSLRSGSKYSQDFLDKNGRRPRPLEGVAHFLKSRDWRELLLDCEASGYSRLAYRFGDLRLFEGGIRDPGIKLTVEFRQHAGTVDGEAIKNWVRTVVGIVGFIVDSDIRAWKDLFSLLHCEEPDAKNGATVEPVLAETEFTIIDLLRYMDLYIPAMYYQNLGTYKIRKRPEGEREMFYFYAGSAGPGDSLGIGEDSETQRQLREEMQAQQRAFHEPVTSGFLHDPHDTSGMQSWSWRPTAGWSDATSTARTDDTEQKGRYFLHDTPWLSPDGIVEEANNQKNSWKGKGFAEAQAPPTSSFSTEDMQDITDTLSERTAAEQSTERNQIEHSRNEGDTSEPPRLSGFFEVPDSNVWDPRLGVWVARPSEESAEKLDE